ncbi:hypothetical protein SAMN04487775_105160 [Treponema bryantii]|uniref:Uncharacterized protein n=1 Tax=Treponema bryantii TaxID=163 RepID=A0A1I3KTP7_9SPIR|nr:hypothetical protein [Treponema bryantii]SFI75806.1 hypothetical protein SAMN04487775_105160 [Treponema bryantii]
MILNWPFFATTPARLEMYADTQKTAGIKILTPLMEFRTANRPDKFNIGLLLTTGNYIKQLPFELKVGNLSASGSLSRLNSPELSNGTSPFSNGLISTTPLSISLPGTSSFSKPESSFCQIKFKDLIKKPLSVTMNLWVSPENASPVFSTMISNKFFSNQLSLNTQFTAGNFFYDDNSTSSWFLESPFYEAGSHFCSMFQFSSDYKSKKSKAGLYSGLMAVLYETPFGPYTAAYRADVKVTIKRTEFSTSAFLNQYEDVLTSSGKKHEPCCQFKAGVITSKPLLLKSTELAFLKFGLNGYTRFNLMKAEHPVRINTGLQLNTSLTSISFSVSETMLLTAQSAELAPDKLKNQSALIQINNSWYLKKLTPSLLLSIEKQFSDSMEQANTLDLDTTQGRTKYKLQLNIASNTKHKVSGSSAVTLSSKDGQITEKKFSAAITGTLNFKHLKVQAKASASFDF